MDRTDQLDKGSDGFQIDVLFYLCLNFHTHTHSIAGDGPSVRDSDFPLQKVTGITTRFFPPPESDLVLSFFVSFIAHAL